MDNQWKDFFKTSRHERVGTWLIIAVIAALLIALFVVRNKPPAVPDQVLSTNEREFLNIIDSADAVAETRQERKADKQQGQRENRSNAKEEKARKHSGKKHGSEPVAAKPFDPVPQLP